MITIIIMIVIMNVWVCVCCISSTIFGLTFSYSLNESTDSQIGKKIQPESTDDAIKTVCYVVRIVEGLSTATLLSDEMHYNF